MQSQVPHFFVATLGDAQRINSVHPHGITTINQLILRRARTTPDAVAVGMSIPLSGAENSERWGTILYSYSQLLRAITAAAHRLSAHLPPAKELPDKNHGPVVGILSESSWDMLLCFFGLIRMGYTVLLIAPQCDARAIRHLVVTTSAKMLLYSRHLASLELAAAVGDICSHEPLPIHEREDVQFPHDWWPTPEFVQPSTPAYIHASGTSSGLPTPIPQNHASATVHLPSLMPQKPVSTLTTSPLYHGGIADVMRSLMSCSMIWLFPPMVPLTPQNLLRAVIAADERLPASPIKLFTGAPYVLRMCLADEQCLAALRNMDMVGYGGAPLPENSGNALVANGVKLVSRFGIAECGFLMSSYRNFELDKAWNYLRVPPSTDHLSFESLHDGTRELVVLPGWPYMARQNRPDGSFATSDLFQPHPIILRAYKYVTRSDSTVVLLNDTKFDPVPIEDSLRQLDWVDEAIVFGQNQDCPGVLLFPNRPGNAYISFKDRLSAINTALPSDAQIPPELVIVIPFGRGWPRSSKGTALRNKAEEAFLKEITQARYQFEHGSPNHRGVIAGSLWYGPGDMERVLSAIVAQRLKRTVGLDDDLFLAGVDSIMAASIRRELMTQFGTSLPENILFEQRTVQNLTNFLIALLKGLIKVEPVDKEKKHELKVMQEMLGTIQSVEQTGGKPQVVLLTGVTGALGAHVLRALIQIGVKKIICLCRATNASEASSRLVQSFQKRKIPLAWAQDTSVRASICSLPEKNLGLPVELYAELASEVTTIIHCAWPVNFLAPFHAFEPIIEGTKNLLEIANTGTKKRFVFCSSTASVIRTPSPIREEVSDNPEHASPLGYSRSKWVAEGLVRRAGGEVIRLGQLSGDSKEGIWNPEESWPMLLSTLQQVGCLPALDENVQWLPVDIAAEAVSRIAVRRKEEFEDRKVWHVLNSHAVPWKRVLNALENWCGCIRRVPQLEWVNALEHGERCGQTVKLMGLWKEAYGNEEKKDPEPVFEVRNMDLVWPGFGDGKALEEGYFYKIFEGLGLGRKFT
ncbi:hypothetical protein FN846DRAFT_596725 [Sphaerosporella brunnea]|uniref:Carrier domain-containing protein n=1 Tax=Sphaerosporella brunnea TaxID=1250544 RepID=A0A5J5F0U2_9PEZI|nr:hypothetical protein FN846DRAFT_596725 [Sphaerosporella brunnea]